MKGCCFTILAACLALATFATPAGADDVTAPVPVDECSDSVDNDADGHVDYDDEGCSDDTPTTELLTRLPTLSKLDAEIDAEDAMDDRFGRKYRHNDAEYLKCKRRTRTSFRCRFAFIYRITLYSGMIAVWEFRDKDEAWIDYRVKHWWKARDERVRDAIAIKIKWCGPNSCHVRLTVPL